MKSSSLYKFFCLVLVLALSNANESRQPIWTFYNSDVGYYICGSSLSGIVRCQNNPHQVAVLQCYCITYNNDIEDFTIAQCPYNCYFSYDEACLNHNIVNYTNSSVSWNVFTCSRINRDGHLCGTCLKGYGYPVYSYSLKCVECSEKDLTYNLLKYILCGFLPLTIFYVVVITFKLAVNTHQMVAYVFACQVITIPTFVEIVMTQHKHGKLWYDISLSLISMWNLNFFRSIYDPFCIHPKMTALQVIALDYIIAVYPMFLIAITYIAVTLHSRYAIVVLLWSPVQRILTYVRKEWDIRGTLVQAFATFLTLSYVKILHVSFDLLSPAHPQNTLNKHINQTYVYKVGTVKYFGQEHIPFAALALSMMTLFNILPILLLLFYPYSWFRKCILCGTYSPTLHTFVECYNGYYRSKPRIYLSFSALYFISHFVQLILFTRYRGIPYFFCSTIHFLVLGMINVLLQPQKHKCWNKINSTITLYLSLNFAVFNYSTYSRSYQHRQYKQLFLVIFGLSWLSGIVYSVLVILTIIFPKSYVLKLVRKIYHTYFKKGETMPLLTWD